MRFNRAGTDPLNCYLDNLLAKTSLITHALNGMVYIRAEMSQLTVYTTEGGGSKVPVVRFDVVYQLAKTVSLNHTKRM